MRRSAGRAWRRFSHDTSGSEIAEFAVVVPLLFMFLMAIFWFGQAYSVYGTLTQASRAGARAAVAPVCATCAAATTPTQNAVAAVTSAMTASHMNTAQLQPLGSWTPPALCPCGSASAACGAPVACEAASINACVQLKVQLSYPATAPGGMGTCGTSVSMRYRYPFHFSIPFTNLDLNTIALPGQAEMRAETQ
jgi:Flp pilus assembly protein TadG